MQTEGTEEVIARMESTRRAVEEIIADEEVDRSTPAEVIAGIEAAMREIKHLRELNQRQATMVFELRVRIDRMVALAEAAMNEQKTGINFVLEAITSGGSHNDRNGDVIRAARNIAYLNRKIDADKSALKSLASGETTKAWRDMDDIPF